VVDVVNFLKLIPVLDFFICLLGVDLLNLEVFKVAFGQLFLVVKNPCVLDHWGGANLVLQVIDHLSQVEVVLRLHNANVLVAQNAAETLNGVQEALLAWDVLEKGANIVFTAFLFRLEVVNFANE